MNSIAASVRASAEVALRKNVAFSDVERLAGFSRGDILDREGYVASCAKELEALGPLGGPVLAFFIRQASYSATRGIVLLLHVAQQVGMTPVLKDALVELKKRPQYDDCGATRYSPELTSNDKIGWSDSTFRTMKELIDGLLSRPSKQGDSESGEYTIEFLCDRCHAEAAGFRNPKGNGEFVCGKCYKSLKTG